VTLLGATTENPSFESIRLCFRVPACMSCGAHGGGRARDRAPGARGHGTWPRRAGQAIARGRGCLVAISNGDARVALNALELASDATGGDREISLADIREALQRRSLLYDRAGTATTTPISAFIKSVRGRIRTRRSTGHADDRRRRGPMFIARRIVILAGEDVGLADPQALVIATARSRPHTSSVSRGLLPLAEATVYLALAPKSDSLSASGNPAGQTRRARPGAASSAHCADPTSGESQIHRRLGEREVALGKPMRCWPAAPQSR